MMRVHAPGLLTTVQDLGRPGGGPLGISPAGAADPVALRLGNILLGNPPHAAALEMTLSGGAFEFEEPTLIALTGSDFGAACEGRRLELWRTHEIPAGGILQIGRTASGARCYLCVRGGFAVERWLGSASTHVLSGLGGFHGRPLRKGDALAIYPSRAGRPHKRIRPEVVAAVSPRRTLRVTRGPHSNWFEYATVRTFTSHRYTVTEDANRMGLRLAGPALATRGGGQMITEGVSLGAIQVPPAGQPIILFVDQQTTGGYPIVANIIAADLPSIGQLRPRDEIRFEMTSFEQARRLIIEQEMLLGSGEDLLCE
jgi:antagonist of KipI